MPAVASFAKAIKHIRKAALSFPETREDHPWGESAFKVRDKVFLFMSEGEGQLRITVKLPESRGLALLMPFAQPTGYGLGKSGWITASLVPNDPLPLPMLLDWMEESFCAVAAKKVITSWKAGATPESVRKRP
ncbi:MmcQ/YjbR family DNA-binding protein [Geothrix sp. PMB-07]|uniref:MmcQ/YjbR family DNA-binding protein n=1 Tax=Geothrix sp. PMB-07 TaxID=3068640 RepID=UPI00274140E4|nr:MmcQ/YjbR family DNA-binding protein [Geothrix sp. PMB-07]WLT29989.1 MmcQ/YjbR family DNA-binding protein [Geothrix sp. PMB-07]